MVRGRLAAERVAVKPGFGEEGGRGSDRRFDVLDRDRQSQGREDRIGLLPESSFTIEGSHGRESETIGLASIETEPHGGGRCQVEISHGAVAGLSIKHRPAKRPSLLTLKAGESTVISEVYALELVRVVPWDEARSFGDWAEFRVIDLRNGLPADAELPENVRSEM